MMGLGTEELSRDDRTFSECTVKRWVVGEEEEWKEGQAAEDGGRPDNRGPSIIPAP
jgi:hypothetical protein